jgi:hypothetical protein
MIFYSPNDEKDSKVSERVNKILSVYKNIGEQGRSEEEWVNTLNDKVHLMRVDVTELDNARSVSDYKVSETPLVVLLDKDNIEFMEILSDKTYDHVKDFYAPDFVSKEEAEAQAKAEAKAKNQAEDRANDQAIAYATKAANDAKKSATDAQRSLAEAKKAFEDHIKEHHDNDEDSKKDAKKDIKKDGSDNDDSLPSEGNKNQQQNSQPGSQPSGELQAPPGYTIDYVPVYTKIDDLTPAASTTNKKPVTTTKLKPVSDHWHMVS